MKPRRRPHEHFNTFLRSLDAEREGLPTWFVDRLMRAVAHYDIDGLDPSDELEAALLRIFMSQQRRDDQVPVVLALLDRQETPLPGLRDTLDHVIEATRRRYPSIASLARAVRYRLFDRPLHRRGAHRRVVDDAPDRRRPGDSTSVAADSAPTGRHRRSARRLPAPARCRSWRKATCSPTPTIAGPAARGAHPPLLQDPRARPDDRRTGRRARRGPRVVLPSRPHGEHHRRPGGCTRPAGRAAGRSARRRRRSPRRTTTVVDVYLPLRRVEPDRHRRRWRPRWHRCCAPSTCRPRSDGSV